MIFPKRPSKNSDMAQVGSQMLTETVRKHMEDADQETVQIVGAIAGLLACVAYADREYSNAERDHIRQQLSRIHGLSNSGIDTICTILDERILEVTATSGQRYMRELRELTDYETRLEVLDTLLDLAASDEVLSMDETNLLRRTATGLGLTQEEYNNAQARYRDRLSVLR